MIRLHRQRLTLLILLFIGSNTFGQSIIVENILDSLNAHLPPIAYGQTERFVYMRELPLAMGFVSLNRDNNSPSIIEYSSSWDFEDSISKYGGLTEVFFSISKIQSDSIFCKISVARAFLDSPRRKRKRLVGYSNQHVISKRVILIYNNQTLIYDKVIFENPGVFVPYGHQNQDW